MLSQEVQDHLLVFPAQEGAGGVKEHAPGTDIPLGIVQNGPLDLRQPLQGLRVFIADVRLFPDDSQP